VLEERRRDYKPTKQGRNRSGEVIQTAETLPVDRPRHTHVPANQNVGMIPRLFVFDTKWVRVFFRHSVSLKQFSAPIEVEACEDHGLRQLRVVSALPKGICQAHRVR
jgi:hypothetical protein